MLAKYHQPSPYSCREMDLNAKIDLQVHAHTHMLPGIKISTPLLRKDTLIKSSD